MVSGPLPRMPGGAWVAKVAKVSPGMLWRGQGVSSDAGFIRPTLIGAVRGLCGRVAPASGPREINGVSSGPHIIHSRSTTNDACGRKHAFAPVPKRGRGGTMHAPSGPSAGRLTNVPWFNSGVSAPSAHMC